MFTDKGKRLNQGFNSNHKKESRASVFCGFSNHKSQKWLKITNRSARKEIFKKNKKPFGLLRNLSYCKILYPGK